MDQAKEALFNILENSYDFEDCKVLDLFSGTGNIAFEFISRGCKDLTCVERHYQGITYTKRICKELKCEEYLNLFKMDVLKYLNKCDDKFDIIFADPPYDYPYYEKLIKLVFDKCLLNEQGIIIVEHDLNVSLDSHQNFLEKRKYGASHFSFFSLG